MILPTYIRAGKSTEFEVVVSGGQFAETTISAFSFCADATCEGHVLQGTCPTVEEIAASRKRRSRGPSHMQAESTEALQKAMLDRVVSLFSKREESS